MDSGDVGYLGLAASLVLVAVALAISLRLRLRLERELVVSVVRGLVQLAAEALEHGRRLGVQRRRRLVHQHHARVRRQRSREAGALRLSARELARVAPQEARVEARALEQLGAARLVAVAVGLAQVVEHGARERQGPLEDHRQLAPQHERVALRDVAPAMAHHAGRWHLEAVAEAQQRRLPGPGRPGDDRQTGVGQLRVEAVEPARVGRADADRLKGEERRHGHGGSIAHRRSGAEAPRGGATYRGKRPV